MSVRRVFLSAVSSEFEGARDALANDLQGHEGVTVLVQRSFHHDHAADTLLQRLRNAIAGCDTVIFLIGDRSGTGFPEKDEAAVYKDELPDGFSEASYTQWEFFFARRLGKRCLIYFAADGFRKDPGPDDRADLQTAFVGYVKSLGPQWRGVRNIDDFLARVANDFFAGVGGGGGEPPHKPIVLPYPSIGSLFKGRDAFMARLRASLTRDGGGAAAIAGRAVHGLGGVGKTRAAVEYAWAYRDAYNAIALLQAETADRLQSSLAALTGPLRLPEAAAIEDKMQIEAVIAWLNANPCWLLIFDNLDSDAALQAAHSLLGRLSGGHVVLTGRWDRFPDGIEQLDMDLLDLPDATAFLLEATDARRQRTPDDQERAERLAADLDRLALSLSMASATIKARQMSFARYWTLWEENREKVIGWASPQIAGYHHAVAETWQTSVDQLSPDGRTLLERLAYLAPDPVPRFLLGVPVPSVDDIDTDAALDDLAAYSLVSRGAEDGTFQVHRLVQDVTRRALEKEGRATDRLTEALRWVTAGFMGESQDVRFWPYLDPLVPHVETVGRFAEQSAILYPTVLLFNQLGKHFYFKADNGRAEPLMRHGVAMAEGQYGESDPQIVMYLGNLAQLLQRTNRMQEAEALMRRVLAICETNFEESDVALAFYRNNIAMLLFETGRWDEAERLLRNALAIFEFRFDEAAPQIANLLNNLAQVLSGLSRFEEAEPLIRRAIAIGEDQYGKSHPEVARHLNTLSQLLLGSGRPQEVELMLERALEIYERNYDAGDPRIAVSVRNLGSFMYEMGRNEEAEKFFRKSLETHFVHYGDQHPEVATDLNSLGVLLRDVERFEEAEPLLRQALMIAEASPSYSPHSRDSLAGTAQPSGIA